MSVTGFIPLAAYYNKYGVLQYITYIYNSNVVHPDYAVKRLDLAPLDPHAFTNAIFDRYLDDLGLSLGTRTICVDMDNNCFRIEDGPTERISVYIETDSTKFTLLKGTNHYVYRVINTTGEYYITDKGKIRASHECNLTKTDELHIVMTSTGSLVIPLLLDIPNSPFKDTIIDMKSAGFYACFSNAASIHDCDANLKPQMVLKNLPASKVILFPQNPPAMFLNPMSKYDMVQFPEETYLPVDFTLGVYTIRKLVLPKRAYAAISLFLLDGTTDIILPEYAYALFITANSSSDTSLFSRKHAITCDYFGFSGASAIDFGETALTVNKVFSVITDESRVILKKGYSARKLYLNLSALHELTADLSAPFIEMHVFANQWANMWFNCGPVRVKQFLITLRSDSRSGYKFSHLNNIDSLDIFVFNANVFIEDDDSVLEQTPYERYSKEARIAADAFDEDDYDDYDEDDDDYDISFDDVTLEFIDCKIGKLTIHSPCTNTCVFMNRSEASQIVIPHGYSVEVKDGNNQPYKPKKA